jgi:hypothetical protein
MGSMGKREDEIEDIIRNKVFIGCFGRGEFKRGKEILRKLYFQYYPILDNFETRRMILYNYIVGERMDTNIESVIKKYSEQLKNDMDNEPNYKEMNTKEYCMMLAYYCDTHKKELGDVELISIYTFSYEYYKKIGSEIDMLNAKFNLALIKRDFKIVFEIIKGIHNSNDKIYKAVLSQILNDIKNTSNEIYEQSLKIINNSTKLSV